MAAHVPVNTALLYAMLRAPTPALVAVSQAANQVYNVCAYYANKNMTNQVPGSVVAASFGAAIAFAVGVGYGLSKWSEAAVARALAAGSARRAAFARGVRTLTPFFGAAAAKPLQLSLLRGDELAHGVAVSDAAGNVVGSSQAAGRYAVAATILTRIIYLAPMLYLPALHAALAVRLRLPVDFSRGSGSLATATPSAAARGASLALYIALTAASSAGFTPACMALFAQRAGLPIDALEPEIADAARAAAASRGAPPPATLYFNKGL